MASFVDRGWWESGRTPLKQAILTTIEPKLYPIERSFLAANYVTL